MEKIPCEHIIAKGAKEGQQCDGNGLHGGYCWRHKKKVVPVHIANEVGGPAIDKPKKYKFSAFRFTANSNTSSVGMSVEQVKEFKRLIGFVFDKDNIANYLVDKTNDDPKVNLAELDTSYFFEIAPTTHALHAHGVVKLKHTGHYSLATDVIREIIDGSWGKKVHLNIQASGDSDAAWAQYIQKAQGAEKV